MDNNKVLFVSQEIAPYLPSTPTAELGRSMTQGVLEKGFEVRTFMPKFGAINERRNQLHEVIRLSGLNINIDDNDHPLIIKVATLQPTRMQVYFIDNDEYFRKFNIAPVEGIVNVPAGFEEQMMFFTQGVIETVKKLRWEPAVIHAMGWMSALTPLYIKNKYGLDPIFRGSKVVFSLQNDPFSGEFDDRVEEKLKMSGVDGSILKQLLQTEDAYMALNKLAIFHSDAIVQLDSDVSPVLLDFANACKKPILTYGDPDTLTTRLSEFYKSL